MKNLVQSARQNLDLVILAVRRPHCTSASNWELPLLCSLLQDHNRLRLRCTDLVAFTYIGTLPDFTTAIQSSFYIYSISDP